MPAVSVHHTATTDADWDGPGAVAALSDDATQSDFEHLFAWEPADLDERKSKSNWKFPHHQVESGKPRAANITACQSVISVLNGGMGGADIPDADRKGVYDHVAAHLKDAGKTPAELKALPETDKETRNDPLVDIRVDVSGHQIVTAPVLIRSVQDAFTAARTHKGAMALHQQRFLDGDVRAARALFLDAVKVQALSTRMARMQIRAAAGGAGGTRRLFTGYASVTEAPYEMYDWYGPYTEIVRQGAFGKTLSEGCDTAFLMNHGGVTMARTKGGTLRLAEDDIGLDTQADIDTARSDVAILASAVEGGEVDEMSFAFWITRGMWSPDYEQFDILEVSLDKGDVSAVNYGANPHTGGLVGLRSRQLANLARSNFPALVREAYKRRTGEYLAPADLGAMLHIVGLATQSDDTPDETRAILAQILGAKAERTTGAAPSPIGRENIGEPVQDAAQRDRIVISNQTAPVVDTSALRSWAKDRAAEIRAGKTLSAATMEVLSKVLDLVAEADEAVDAAQPLLADLMGVDNPDEDDAQDPDGDEPDDGDDDDVDDVQGTQQENGLSLDLATRQLEALKLASPTRTRL